LAASVTLRVESMLGTAGLKDDPYQLSDNYVPNPILTVSTCPLHWGLLSLAFSFLIAVGFWF